LVCCETARLRREWCAPRLQSRPPRLATCSWARRGGLRCVGAPPPRTCRPPLRPWALRATAGCQSISRRTSTLPWPITEQPRAREKHQTLPDMGPRKPKIVLLGMASKMPVAGVVWQTMHYVLGFERLGYEVYYVEAHARTPTTLMRSE